jgi:hypothetical protein
MRRDPAQRHASPDELAAACVAAIGHAPRRLDLLDPPRAPADGSSRRQFTRAPYVTPVRVLGQAGACDGRTEDISEQGLLVVTSGSCVEGDEVTVRLPLPSSGRVVTLPGIARWAKTQRGQRAIGIELGAIPPDARADIRNYVALMTGQTPSLRPAPAPSASVSSAAPGMP